MKYKHKLLTLIFLSLSLISSGITSTQTRENNKNKDIFKFIRIKERASKNSDLDVGPVN